MAPVPGGAARCSGGLDMKKKIVVGIAALAGAIAMLIPVSSRAATPTCLVINGPGGFHLQIGYAPHGPSDCQHIP